VLSTHLQTATVSIYAKGDCDLITRAAKVQKEAREHRLTAIHVQIGIRPGLPESSLRDPLLSAIRNSVQQPQLFQGAAGAIHPAVESQQADIVITKHRISAFAGTDLDMILGPRRSIRSCYLESQPVALFSPLCFMPAMPTTASSLLRMAASIWIQKFTLVSSRNFSRV